MLLVRLRCQDTVGVKQHYNRELITEVPLMDSSWEDLKVASIGFLVSIKQCMEKLLDVLSSITLVQGDGFSRIERLLQRADTEGDVLVQLHMVT